MEFYKMFHVLHRRTDWIAMFRWQRQIMMPEWYVAEELKAKAAYDRLMLPFTVVDRCLQDKNYCKF